MDEVGFLQVKVIRANDLPATDLNGNSPQPERVSDDDGGGDLSAYTMINVTIRREKQPLLRG